MLVYHGFVTSQPTLDKLAYRLQNWRGKLMAGNGRLRLINVVLFYHSGVPDLCLQAWGLGNLTNRQAVPKIPLEVQSGG